MLADQGAVFETLRQMRRFLDDNTSTLDVVILSRAREHLDETVERISALAVDQVGGGRTAQGETAKQAALRLDLRYYHMQPIALIAGHALREKPEFTSLELPRFKVRGRRLITAARDMANAAEQYTELFVDEGLRPDFVAKLRAATDRLEESMVARDQSNGQRAGATAGLKAEAKRGRMLIKLLDSLVRPQLGVNDALIREWEVASHVQRTRRSVNATPATASETTAEPAMPPVALVA